MPAFDPLNVATIEDEEDIPQLDNLMQKGSLKRALKATAKLGKSKKVKVSEEPKPEPVGGDAWEEIENNPDFTFDSDDESAPRTGSIWDFASAKAYLKQRDSRNQVSIDEKISRARINANTNFNIEDMNEETVESQVHITRGKIESSETEDAPAKGKKKLDSLKTTEVEDRVREKRKADFFAKEEQSGPVEDEITSFTEMRLSRPILKAVADLGYTKPTVIQSKGIPIALQGLDLCAAAMTGSGKTAAFIIPVLERLLFRDKQLASTRVLILVPTRELGVQCHSVAMNLSKYSNVQICLCVGGLSSKSQEAELRKKPDIVIATPGRLIDHIHNTMSFTLDSIEIMIIDEADRLLEDGFAAELDEIIKAAPKSRQTMLFSATMTDNVDDLIKLSLNKPVRLFLDKPTSITSKLTQEFIRVRSQKEVSKAAMLVALCARTYKDQAIIFFGSKVAAHRMKIIFGLLGLKAAELHGNLTQLQRLEALDLFRDKKVDFLLATDLAARGLDIKGIKTVINYDMPTSYSQYVHRVGRTARGENIGKSVSFVSEADRVILKQAIKSSVEEVKHRVIPAEVISKFADAVKDLEETVKEILIEEKAEKDMLQAEMHISRAENLVKYQDEIKSRPARTWFQTEKEKIAAKGSKPTKKGEEDDKEKPPVKRGKFAGLTRRKRRLKEAMEDDKPLMKAQKIAAKAMQSHPIAILLGSIEDSSGFNKKSAKRKASPKHDLDGGVIVRERSDVKLIAEYLLNAFSVLLPNAPQIKSLAQKMLRNPIFAQNSVLEILSGENEYNLRLACHLRNLYRLIKNLDALKTIWNWNSLYLILNQDRPPIAKAYAVFTLSIILGITDSEQVDLFDKYVHHPSSETGSNSRFLSVAEQCFDEEQTFHLFAQVPARQDHSIQYIIQATDLCPHSAVIADIILPRIESQESVPEHESPGKALVMTPSTHRNLHEMALGVSLGLPILVEGMPGVGKTFLIEEAAKIISNSPLLVAHIGDQTDSKALIGTYVSQAKPGEFKWVPGILTTAVLEGRWLLVEDIDLAPPEVVSVLLPLLESRHLFIASRGEKIRANEGFQLFATRTLFSGAKDSRSLSSSDILSKSASLWTKISLLPLEDEEAIKIIQHRFPSLVSCIGLIMKAFKGIQKFFLETTGITRSLSFRDLIKWCSRIATFVPDLHVDSDDVPLQFRESFFREGVDCFTLMIAKHDLRQRTTQYFGELLDIPSNRIEFFMDYLLPSIELKGTQLQVGRCCLGVSKGKRASKGESFATFAMTRLSLRLMERLAVAIYLNEPVLLVGETGTGKTTAIQYLSQHCEQNLIVVNLSQQSDSSDLLGGFKPVDARTITVTLAEKFYNLFGRTFSAESNAAFLDSVKIAVAKKKWEIVRQGFANAIKMAEKVLAFSVDKNQTDFKEQVHNRKRAKKLKDDPNLIGDWREFADLSSSYAAQLEHVKSSFLFDFIEGTLVKAIVNGDWILLDEVNLASSETLECLSSLLQGSEGSVTLLERGDTKPVKRHPNFRVFACMNPATDAGKRDLPPGLLSRFSEIWVDSPDTDRNDLLLIVRQHLHRHLPPPHQGGDLICGNVADFYLEAKSLMEAGKLVDGSNARVHINMRTLSRALAYTRITTPTFGLQRALYEGCLMTFTTMLSSDSLLLLEGILKQFILNGIKNPASFLKSVPKRPGAQQTMDIDGDDVVTQTPTHILFNTFWVSRGAKNPDPCTYYVITPSVEKNLVALARAVTAEKFPILIQGPTSAGKTSMIEYLAKRTGHTFVRVNNHEHTDIQEYIGTYSPDKNGQLVFQEGVLVEALRKGFWIVLDELNLAPSDVLEALNRLLDDNRELFIPETQENPPGLYGGRKQLSKAFRSRFLELHFDDIPENELSTILERRCMIAPSYASKIVSTYKGLRLARQRSRIFEGKNAFATLRDLFRWANRKASSWETLAEDGYMLLAERARRSEEKSLVFEVLEAELKVKIDPESFYERIWSEIIRKVHSSENEAGKLAISGIVWTKAMKRLLVLVHNCITFREPILLVGETGCGKTTICQVIADILEVDLHIVNAHANSETSDFLGSMRPVRNNYEIREQLRTQIFRVWQDLAQWSKSPADRKTVSELGNAQDLGHLIMGLRARLEDVVEIPQSLESGLARVLELEERSKSLFEWKDGPLIAAMRKGDAFLLDELSLADDSVLERLNSVLEPERTIVLAEKGRHQAEKQNADNSVPTIDVEQITAEEKFCFFSTMNPGGDYGKKELSPALRNRFTEVWVPQISDLSDLREIITQKIGSFSTSLNFSNLILEFLSWLSGVLGKPIEDILSMRDILAWVEFITCNGVQAAHPLSDQDLFVFGGAMVFVDGIGVNPLFGITSTFTASKLRTEALAKLYALAGSSRPEHVAHAFGNYVADSYFGSPPFIIRKGPHPSSKPTFSLAAPTTSQNAVKVFRAMRLAKPILLEGSPGVGKTTLISSLATMCGYKLCRINLSDQTDLMDLFGSDLPLEGGKGGEFAWRDGPFLHAMNAGDWVLLDELNLASQQVLEGLNACLDHRGEVFIPELDKTFFKHPNFRVFAAQNPQYEGGGRKGLPKSFVNRFTQVYIDSLSTQDLQNVAESLYPNIESSVVEKMIAFNQAVHNETTTVRSFGNEGSPWEFNLRDILRWLELSVTNPRLLPTAVVDPTLYADILYKMRMRTSQDRSEIERIFAEIFGCSINYCDSTVKGLFMTSDSFLAGRTVQNRVNRLQVKEFAVAPPVFLSSSEKLMEVLSIGVKMGWTTLVVGSSGVGKTSAIRSFARACGQHLSEFAMNPSIDASELIGGFEQLDLNRLGHSILSQVRSCLNAELRYLLHIQNRNEFIETAKEFINVNRSDFEPTGLRLVCKKMQNLIETLGDGIRRFVLESNAPLPLQILGSLDDYDLKARSSSQGRFEWVDGSLIRAMETGTWLLIDNVNLCPASVLDRLNSLLEPDGFLAISERGVINGEVKIAKPHPNFRLFLAMDPRFGELSRAMRNRTYKASRV
ncbi:hypothetical protein HDU97_006249 [Phlyctochytrium planicorne]|nr:hypothetical protein HDU97_006249 [Phlyctochytrium planicorne]